MIKTKKRALSSYTLRESGIDNNLYGWFEESNNRWIIEPKLTYQQAMLFDFNKYNRRLETYRKRLIREILKDKKFKANVNEAYKQDIEFIKRYFSVKHIKYACSNYHPEYCERVLNKTCIMCNCRFNDFESLEKKGGNNE